MNGAAATADWNRVAAFETIFNFRDYGGYRARDGLLRRDLLLRSGQHHGGSDDDIAKVGRLRLAAIVDLRGKREREGMPCPRPAGCTAQRFLVDEETAGLAPHLDAAREALDVEGARKAMGKTYRAMPFQPVLVRALTHYFASLAEVDGPNLVHCMAGKDRTGLAVALLHGLLGVHRDDMVADFLLTNTAGDAARRVEASTPHLQRYFRTGLTPEAALVILSVEEAYLDEAFAAIREAHGDIRRYLRDMLGVDDARAARIAARLIE